MKKNFIVTVAVVILVVFTAINAVASPSEFNVQRGQTHWFIGIEISNELTIGLVYDRDYQGKGPTGAIIVVATSHIQNLVIPEHLIDQKGIKFNLNELGGVEMVEGSWTHANETYMGFIEPNYFFRTYTQTGLKGKVIGSFRDIEFEIKKEYFMALYAAAMS